MQLSKAAAIGNVLFLILPFLWILYAIAFRSFFHLPMNEKFSLGVVYFGFGVFLISKWPQLKEFDFWTFGTKGMSPIFKKLYYSGYFLMVLGLLICFYFHHENRDILGG